MRVDEGTCIIIQILNTTYFVLGVVLLCLLETRGFLASLYGVFSFQQWCPIQVALEHMDGCFMTIQVTIYPILAMVENMVEASSHGILDLYQDTLKC